MDLLNKNDRYGFLAEELERPLKDLSVDGSLLLQAIQVEIEARENFEVLLFRSSEFTASSREVYQRDEKLEMYGKRIVSTPPKLGKIDEETPLDLAASVYLFEDVIGHDYYSTNRLLYKYSILSQFIFTENNIYTAEEPNYFYVLSIPLETARKELDAILFIPTCNMFDLHKLDSCLPFIRKMGIPGLTRKNSNFADPLLFSNERTIRNRSKHTRTPYTNSISIFSVRLNKLIERYIKILAIAEYIVPHDERNQVKHHFL